MNFHRRRGKTGKLWKDYQQTTTNNWTRADASTHSDDPDSLNKPTKTYADTTSQRDKSPQSQYTTPTKTSNPTPCRSSYDSSPN